MNHVPEIRSVTVVQEILDPSEMVENVMLKLAMHNIRELRMYTTERRVLDLKEHYSHPSQYYAEQFNRAEALVGALARQALLLSGEAEIQQPTRNDRPARIFFAPRVPAHLEALTGAMHAIPTVEATTDIRPQRLYVDFPPGGMTTDAVRQKDMLDEINERSHHPVAKNFMNAANPRVVFRDLPRFVLRHPAILPDDDE